MVAVDDINSKDRTDLQLDFYLSIVLLFQVFDSVDDIASLPLASHTHARYLIGRYTYCSLGHLHFSDQSSVRLQLEKTSKKAV